MYFGYLKVKWMIRFLRPNLNQEYLALIFDRNSRDGGCLLYKHKDILYRYIILFWSSNFNLTIKRFKLKLNKTKIINKRTFVL